MPTKRIRFSTTIRAAPERVWSVMLAQDTYRQWTRAFAEGSRYEGSWDQGARMRFLGPDGDGMVSEIAESRPPGFLSIRHRGMLAGGVEDTTSEAVRAWAPAYENYTLRAAEGGTELVVDQDVPSDWEDHLAGAWPVALGLLKALCEGGR